MSGPPPFAGLRVERGGARARVTLARPEVHNAFDGALVSELARCFSALSSEPAVRLVVLTGEGRSFCAGADLSWMRTVSGFTEAENEKDAAAVAAMLAAVRDCAKPVVARVNGHALAGGVGLVCACDLAVADDGAQFALSEVRLGIVPAVILPFVLRRVGASAAAELALTGERISAARAREIGLVHRVAPSAELDAQVDRLADSLLAGGPEAQAHVKELLRRVPELAQSELPAYTARMLARRRMSAEGRSGIAAFLSKSEPPWRTAG